MTHPTPRRLAIVLAVVGVLVVGASAPAAAQASLSITGVDLPASVTQGNSFTVTVSVSGSEVSGVSASLTLPSGLSCNPSGSQSVSLDGSGNGQATFDCTADVAGDYRGEITASAQATSSNDGSSVSDNEQTGLRVLSPGAITLSTSMADSTTDVGDSTTVTAVIHNTGSVPINYDVSRSTPSGLSASLSSGSETGTVSGDDIVSIKYSVSGSSAGTYDFSVTADGENGQTLTGSEELSVTGGDGGDGGAGGGADDESTPVSTPAPGTDAADDTPAPSTQSTDDPATAAPATPTATPEPTPTESTATPPATDTAGQPGFGPMIAVVGLLLTIAAARHRRRPNE